MVGTTRPRVGIFLKKFRELGLVEATAEGSLLIEQEKMREYLMRDSKGDCSKSPEPVAGNSSFSPDDKLGLNTRRFRVAKA